MNNYIKLAVLASLTGSLIASEGGRKKRFTLDDETASIAAETERAQAETLAIQEDTKVRRIFEDDAIKSKQSIYANEPSERDRMHEDFIRVRDEIKRREYSAQQEKFSEDKLDFESDTVESRIKMREEERRERNALEERFKRETERLRTAETDRLAGFQTESDFKNKIKEIYMGYGLRAGDIDSILSECENDLSKIKRTDRQRFLDVFKTTILDINADKFKNLIIILCKNDPHSWNIIVESIANSVSRYTGSTMREQRSSYGSKIMNFFAQFDNLEDVLKKIEEARGKETFTKEQLSAILESTKETFDSVINDVKESRKKR